MKRHAAGGNITAAELDALWSRPQRLKDEQALRHAILGQLARVWAARSAHLAAGVRRQRQRLIKPASPFAALLYGTHNEGAP